jgi:hypothetical protein
MPGAKATDPIFSAFATLLLLVMVADALRVMGAEIVTGPAPPPTVTPTPFVYPAVPEIVVAPLPAKVSRFEFALTPPLRASVPLLLLVMVNGAPREAGDEIVTVPAPLLTVTPAEVVKALLPEIVVEPLPAKVNRLAPAATPLPSVKRPLPLFVIVRFAPAMIGTLIVWLFELPLLIAETVSVLMLSLRVMEGELLVKFTLAHV